jgi:hypothetical protein
MVGTAAALRVVNPPVIGDHGEGQSKREQRGLIVDDYVAQGGIFGAIDFSEWEDKQGNGDRDDAVAKGNNSVYAWVSFACHLVTPPFARSSASALSSA